MKKVKRKIKKYKPRKTGKKIRKSRSNTYHTCEYIDPLLHDLIHVVTWHKLLGCPKKELISVVNEIYKA